MILRSPIMLVQYILLHLELNYLTVESQQELLEPLNLIPFKYRLFYRFCLFSHKILNKHFLLNISDLLKLIVKSYSTREKNTNLFEIPLILSNSGAKRISIVLSIMVNNVLRNSTNSSFKDFSEYILSNLHSLFLKFSQFILKEM
jgi:hypothetical protein